MAAFIILSLILSILGGAFAEAEAGASTYNNGLWTSSTTDTWWTPSPTTSQYGYTTPVTYYPPTPTAYWGVVTSYTTIYQYITQPNNEIVTIYSVIPCATTSYTTIYGCSMCSPTTTTPPIVTTNCAATTFTSNGFIYVVQPSCSSLSTVVVPTYGTITTTPATLTSAGQVIQVTTNAAPRQKGVGVAVAVGAVAVARAML